MNTSKFPKQVKGADFSWLGSTRLTHFPASARQKIGLARLFFGSAFAAYGSTLGGGIYCLSHKQHIQY